MPELPEVETVARGLRRAILGRRIVSVTLGKTDFIDDAAALEEHLPGRQIAAVERFGQFMLLRLSAAVGRNRIPTNEQTKTLRRVLQGILQKAIMMRGSSISDFLDAEGEPGEYQRHHRAYGREGKACYRCQTSVRRAIVAGRSSYFCPKCQPGPRGFALLPLRGENRKRKNRRNARRRSARL